MKRANERESLNLSVDSKLKHRIKVQCAIERIDVSKVAEALFVEWLEKRQGFEVPVAAAKKMLLRSARRSSG